MQVVELRAGLGNRCTPVVSPNQTPRLSWKVRGDETAWTQAAYEIECSTRGETISTARVAARDSTNIAWPFAPLASRQQARVRVRVWGAGSGDSRGGDSRGGDSADSGESVSVWSEPVAIEGGLYDPVAEWVAKLITPANDSEARPGPAFLFRHEFELATAPTLARLHITAHGIFDASINGEAVGDDVFAPGWTTYEHRLRYRTHDVTAKLHEGPNAIGVMVADGWFRGPYGFEGGQKNLYGDHVGVSAQLEVEFANGSTRMITTNEQWRATTGPITRTGLYAGETHDARLEHTGWNKPGFDDGTWPHALTRTMNASVLEVPLGPPVRRVELIAPVNVERISTNRIRYDFGQNVSGRLRITASGPTGASFVANHAEVLENGELGLRPLRRAAATDTYTFGRTGSAGITWEPTFTVHGFRYAELTLDEGVEISDTTMVVLHSDMTRTGTFTCSDPLLTRLHDNVLWSMRGNFVDIPTDCPQRDERLGWTGDIQVFTPSATFLYDCEGFLRSWLRDVHHEQQQYGTVPVYVPWIELVFPIMPATAWGDAAVFVPAGLYERYGDTTVLRDQYESMCTWVRQVASLTSPNGLWDTGFQFGDWLDPAAPPQHPEQARTEPSLVATAYLVRSASTLATYATLLGESADAAEFTALAARTRVAFRNEYVTASGRMSSDAQTAYAVAIMFDLLEPSEVTRAGKRLAELVAKDRFCIGTGFVGTPLVCDALQRSGHIDTAYRLLMQTACPSWLYPVTMGATTIWERWDSMLPDGSVNPGDMTSFNHYALGAVADWLHRTVAGLAWAEPGGRSFRFAPRPGGGLTSANASHESPYGPVSISWEREGTVLRTHIVVPPNTTAVVDLLGTDSVLVGSGSHEFTTSVRDATDEAVVDEPNPFFAILRAGVERLQANPAVTL